MRSASQGGRKTPNGRMPYFRPALGAVECVDALGLHLIDDAAPRKTPGTSLRPSCTRGARQQRAWPRRLRDTQGAVRNARGCVCRSAIRRARGMRHSTERWFTCPFGLSDGTLIDGAQGGSAQRKPGANEQVAEHLQSRLFRLCETVANVHVCSHVAVSAQCILALMPRHFQMDAR